MLPKNQLRKWKKRNWAMPSPEFVKRERLLANSRTADVWIETGTYLGETTSFLSETGASVFSVEPHGDLFLAAKKKFERTSNVEIIHGNSEEKLPEILTTIENSKSVSFWLDGHYSGPHTYLGSQVCPVLKELEVIDKHRDRLGELTIFIDDARLFNPESPTGSGYPRLGELVAWAETRELSWWIEHDVFVIKTVKCRSELGGQT